MIRENHARVLFNTRWMAFASVSLATWFAAHKFYVIATHGSPTFSSIRSFDAILPPWTRLALNLLIFAVLILNVGQVWLQSEGFERLYVTIFLSEILLYPVRIFLPEPAALILFWIQAIADVFMMLAALVLCISMGAKAHPHEPLSP